MKIKLRNGLAIKAVKVAISVSGKFFIVNEETIIPINEVAEITED